LISTHRVFPCGCLSTPRKHRENTEKTPRKHQVLRSSEVIYMCISKKSTSTSKESIDSKYDSPQLIQSLCILIGTKSNSSSTTNIKKRIHVLRRRRLLWLFSQRLRLSPPLPLPVKIKIKKQFSLLSNQDQKNNIGIS
jgi:hypothetical protein